MCSLMFLGITRTSLLAHHDNVGLDTVGQCCLCLVFQSLVYVTLDRLESFGCYGSGGLAWRCHWLVVALCVPKHRFVLVCMCVTWWLVGWFGCLSRRLWFAFLLRKLGDAWWYRRRGRKGKRMQTVCAGEKKGGDRFCRVVEEEGKRREEEEERGKWKWSMDKRKKGRQLRQLNTAPWYFSRCFTATKIHANMTKKVRSPCLHDVRQRPVQMESRLWCSLWIANERVLALTALLNWWMTENRELTYLRCRELGRNHEGEDQTRDRVRCFAAIQVM